ncbi:MAG TPA: hypothetical protein VIR76_03995 [Pusillimonas sp.]
MSTISCTPVIGLANSVENHAIESVNTFNAAQAMPARSKSMFVTIQQYCVALLADIRRSRGLAQSAFPSVRGN